MIVITASLRLNRFLALRSCDHAVTISSLVVAVGYTILYSPAWLMCQHSLASEASLASVHFTNLAPVYDKQPRHEQLEEVQNGSRPSQIFV